MERVEVLRQWMPQNWQEAYELFLKLEEAKANGVLQRRLYRINLLRLGLPIGIIVATILATGFIPLFTVWQAILLAGLVATPLGEVLGVSIGNILILTESRIIGKLEEELGIPISCSSIVSLESSYPQCGWDVPLCESFFFNLH